jgi:hypothetical protein
MGIAGSTRKIPNHNSIDNACARRSPAKSIDRYGSLVAAMHKLHFWQVYSHRSNQIALPVDWKAIILAAKVGIGPVGVRPLVK